MGETVIENLRGAGGGGEEAANKVYYGEYAKGEHKLNPQGRAHFPAQRLEFEPSVLGFERLAVFAREAPKETILIGIFEVSYLCGIMKHHKFYNFDCFING